MRPLLRFDAVRCDRGGRTLFDEFHLTLGPGEACLVEGANGRGKSSLLRLAAGLLRPAAGSVVRTVAIALADDTLALDRELPLARALGFWAAADGRRDGLSAAMRGLGLAHLADVPVRLLSTGQAQRARLARVVAAQAPLWLLDEPLNGLDREGVAQLIDAIAAHRADGGAVLAASHQPISGEGWRHVDLGR